MIPLQNCVPLHMRNSPGVWAYKCTVTKAGDLLKAAWGHLGGAGQDAPHYHAKIAAAWSLPPANTRQEICRGTTYIKVGVNPTSGKPGSMPVDESCCNSNLKAFDVEVAEAIRNEKRRQQENRDDCLGKL